MADRWYSTEELAELLGIDPSSLRRWRTACRRRLKTEQVPTDEK